MRRSPFRTLALKILVTFASILLWCPTVHAQSAREIAERTFPSVVLLTMKNADGKVISRGSGFFVRADLIATNFHVIKWAAGGDAKIVGQTASYPIKGVVAADEQRDLAVLKAVGFGAPGLSLGTDKALAVGEKVYVVGNPLGFEGTFSDGIISGIRHAGSQRWLQITAPISPGSSGGPVLDGRGRVVAIAAAYVEEGQSINFAIPITELSLLLKNTGRVGEFPNTRPPKAGGGKTGGNARSGQDEIQKANAEVINATVAYRASLVQLLAVYENDLRQTTAVAEERWRLFLHGRILRSEVEEAELARVVAQSDLNETRAWIEEADRVLIEAKACAANPTSCPAIPDTVDPRGPKGK